jgi:hypothetical protein
MQNHRNISFAGITDKMMTKALTKQEDSFREMLQEQPGAYIVDHTRRILDLGKWNISTDSEHYQALKDWIDQEMPLFYATTTTDGRFADFPEPTRLGQNSTRSFKPKSSPSAYSAQICQQYGATDTAPTVQPA